MQRIMGRGRSIRGNNRNVRVSKSKKEIEKAREDRIKEQQAKDLENWIPRTILGKKVKTGKIKDIDEALKFKILEPEIIDHLLNTREDILNIGQAKGKFGGGKRRAWRQTQRKTKEGNVPTFSCMVVVGSNGYVGLGYGRAKETLPARAKAMRKAKLNLAKIKIACASFDCTCGEPHTVPYIVQGKAGSSRVKLIPAAQGTGLVAGDELKKILRAAGIKDVYSVTMGKKRTTLNMAKACIDALSKTVEM
jgi:small subunit ribosomal protein S5